MKETGLLAFEPILVPKPWGGHRLERLGKPVPDSLAHGARYGESWEVADLPRDALPESAKGRTLVAGGPHHGKSLRQLVAEMGTDLLGSASPTPAGDFPLLIKLLDTAEHLSIQVHPDEEYVAGRHGWSPKTESWYVLDARPGAAIFKGFRPGVTMEATRAAAGTPELAELLQRIPVRRGDFHHLPAGTVHALGAGVTVAEVQTPSDTTLRLYDWTDEYQRSERQLHVEDGIWALVADDRPAASSSPMESNGDRLLVSTPHYWIREHRIAAGDIPALVREPELRILMVTRGRSTISSPGYPPLELGAGSSGVIPAAIASTVLATASDPVTMLEIGLP